MSKNNNKKKVHHFNVRIDLIGYKGIEKSLLVSI